MKILFPVHKPKTPNKSLNTDVQKRRFALLLHAG